MRATTARDIIDNIIRAYKSGSTPTTINEIFVPVLLNESTPTNQQRVTDEVIEKEVLKRYPSTCLDWDDGDAFAKRKGFKDCYKWLSQLPEGEGKKDPDAHVKELGRKIGSEYRNRGSLPLGTEQ